MRATSVFLAAALLLLGLAKPAAAEVDEATRAARWAALAAQLFGERSIAEAGELLAIAAPARAEDAAIVPVRITLGEALRGTVERLYLVIDDNPSPLAGRFVFGSAADPREIAVRVRVDDYTYLHAVAETRDGKLYATARFIKAAGGCSAPAGKDQALAMERLGQMKLTLREPGGPDAPVEAHLLVSHPNASGMQMDQVSRNYIPADFVREIRIRHDDAPVLTVESDISMSEDPSVIFDLPPGSLSGELEAVVDDSSNRHFERRWPLRLDSGR